jgi:hypothetical protein
VAFLAEALRWLPIIGCHTADVEVEMLKDDRRPVVVPVEVKRLSFQMTDRYMTGGVVSEIIVFQ